MANVLGREKQAAVISALAEGSGIRQVERITRLTYAFSKRLENCEAAVALHFAYYNLVKRHGTPRCTPAMAAGIEPDFWTVGNLLEAAT